ncbi:MAG: Ldh family oxidoreductase [Sedimentisphaerales bacterium]|nr:Ldh family oxidoreductase [Sedimentisphaerales bacterium]
MSQASITAEDCSDFIEKIIAKLAAPPQIARRWANLLVETSLLGFDSHGIRMVERYIAHIEDGGIDISAQPEVITEKNGCVNMDAKGGLGHIAAFEATERAIEKAKQFGISCVAVRNANHVGACGLYVRKAALNDCVGICTTVSRASMAPWGGREALLGSNPIAVAAPVQDMPPFLFDAASTIVSMGKITKAKDNNENIPDSWALNQKGNPTTNPNEAIAGTLLPIAGHKGYGLAMVVEILSAFLAGGIPSCDVKSWIGQTKEPIGASFTIIVMDIDKFQDTAAFKKNMKSWIEHLTHSTTREGFEKIYYPGQIEGEKYQHRLQQGIPLGKHEHEMFDKLAAKFAIERIAIKNQHD